MAVVLAASLCGPATVTWAATTDEAAVAVLRPGHHVQATTQTGERLRGRFVTVEDGDLVLADPARRVRLQAVTDVRVRGRATGRGAATGAVTAGLVTGAFFAVGAGAMCETDNCGGASLAGGAIGLGFGALLGATTGGLIGAAVPQWRDVRQVRSASTRDEMGWTSFDVGYGKAFDSLAPAGGAGGRIALTADLGIVSPGLEFGRQFLGGRQERSARGDLVHYNEALTYFGPTLTIMPSRGRVRPYVVGSIGPYYWQAFDPQIANPRSGVEKAVSTRSFWGASVGAGLRRRASGPLSFGIEGRWHTNVTSVPRMDIDESERRLRALSLAVGATLRW